MPRNLFKEYGISQSQNIENSFEKRQPRNLLKEREIIDETQIPEQQEPPSLSAFDWSKLIGQQMAKGALTMGDIYRELGKKMGPTAFTSPHELDPLYRELEGLDIKDTQPLSNLVSETVHEKTPIQRMVGAGARALGSSLATPIPGGYLSAAPISAAIAAGSQGLQEAGMEQVPADILSLGAGLVAPGIARKAFSKVAKPTLSSNEQRVAKQLQERVGEPNIPEVLPRLKESPSPIGYAPTTAELADNPALSQVHRAQYPIAESFLPEKMEESWKTLQNALEKESTKHPLTGEQFQRQLLAEHKKRKAFRKSETEPLYEKVNKSEELINTPKLNEYLQNERKFATGSAEDALNLIEKGIKPKLTKKQIEDEKFYQSLSPQQRTKLPPLDSQVMIGKLSTKRKEMNSKIKSLMKSGEEYPAKILIGARNAIDEDLAHFSHEKIARERFKELSPPINEIEQYHTFKNFMKDAEQGKGYSAQAFKKRVMNADARENIKAIKKIYENDSDLMDSLRRTVVHDFIESFSNKKTETARYEKMDNYLKSYGKAMDEILTPEQQKLVDMSKKYLKGREITEQKGKEKGSITSANLINEQLRKEGISLGKNIISSFVQKLGPMTGAGIGAVSGAVPGAIAGSAIGSTASEALKNFEIRQNEKLRRILSDALLDPEYAHKLLSHEFKNQSKFNNFMNSVTNVTRQTIPIASKYASQEEGESNE
jgi:hypothetical protein